MVLILDSTWGRCGQTGSIVLGSLARSRKAQIVLREMFFLWFTLLLFLVVSYKDLSCSHEHLSESLVVPSSFVCMLFSGLVCTVSEGSQTAGFPLTWRQINTGVGMRARGGGQWSLPWFSSVRRSENNIQEEAVVVPIIIVILIILGSLY